MFSIAFFADAQITTNVRQMFYFAEQKCADLTFLEAASNLYFISLVLTSKAKCKQTLQRLAKVREVNSFGFRQIVGYLSGFSSTVSIGYSNLGYSGRARDLNPSDGPP